MISGLVDQTEIGSFSGAFESRELRVGFEVEARERAEFWEYFLVRVLSASESLIFESYSYRLFVVALHAMYKPVRVVGCVNINTIMFIAISTCLYIVQTPKKNSQLHNMYIICEAEDKGK